MENITEDMNLSDFEEELEMPTEETRAQEYCKLLLKEFVKLRKDIKGVKKEQWEQFKNKLDTALLVANMSDCIVQLETENKMLKEDQVITNEKILRLEYQQRINNLLLDGFDEIWGETDMDCYNKVRRAIAIIYEKQNPNGGNENGDPYELAGRIVVNRIHWNGKFQIGQKRAITVNFQNYTDRQFVMRNHKLLPEDIYINEDFPSGDTGQM